MKSIALLLACALSGIQADELIYYSRTGCQGMSAMADLKPNSCGNYYDFKSFKYYGRGHLKIYQLRKCEETDTIKPLVLNSPIQNHCYSVDSSLSAYRSIYFKN
ncbi:hypothetical protein BB558_002076 [Smittium angustum]|uniref:Uncharacterized protein n=1 Tax=Smittium angustum TaxID=133377 RepID=A0A2U1J9N8_SMIAN|nr:hypothetical protein BB558_007442 [Smittium angustum]PWA01786.1 hypothetical protein BB558_002076 [Smittium angustum]